MPMGAAIALRGIEGCMMMLHGSQGCSAYMRNHLTTHYSEPIDIASSSLHENATIHGGANNLKKGLKNLIQLYEPKVIGVATTCLAETIGEDVERLITEFRAENDLGDVQLLYTNTPGYGGTLYEGYFATLRAIVKQFAKPVPKHDRINVIMGHVSPGDVRNLQDLLTAFHLPYILLPDYSRTFDAPYTNDFKRVPGGGTRLIDVAQMGGARATLEIGVTVPENLSPGRYLRDAFNVPLYQVPIPFGLRGSDRLMQTLSALSGQPLAPRLQDDRGRLIDGMVDAHKLFGELRALIYGEPDIVYAVTRLCREVGILPVIISTGAASAAMVALLEEEFLGSDDMPLILHDTDFETIEARVLEGEINLIIGNSSGKQLTEKYGIPPVRVGFPIQDRIGGQRLVYTGYNGSLRFLDDIGNAILSRKFGTHRKVMYEKYYHPEDTAEVMVEAL